MDLSLLLKKKLINIYYILYIIYYRNIYVNLNNQIPKINNNIFININLSL